MPVWTEFQPLKSIVLGNLFPTDELLSYIGLKEKWAGVFRHINDESIRELDAIEALLRSRNIRVCRPSPYPLSTDQGPAGPALSPRDWLMVYGNTAIQGNDAFANHHVRTTSTLPIHDLNTTCMPTNNEWIIGGFNDAESSVLERPYYHTANFLRCGKDIFYSDKPCRTGNNAGLQWMMSRISLINPDVRFHAIDAEEHLDGHIMFIRPGLMISTISKNRLPCYFSKWEVITIKPDEKHRAYKKTLAFKWKKLNPIVAAEYAWFMQANPEETWFSVNGLSLDENTAIFPGVHARLFTKLEKLGVECLSVSMRAVSFWDSGLHCCTSELDRQGDLEDYQ